MSARETLTRLETWAKSPGGKRAINIIRALLFIAVIAFLIYRISLIGWGRVWAERPRTIWFYVVGLGIYFYLPAFESIIYHRLFGASPRVLLPALIQKRVLNMDLFDYSGEVFFVAWARRRKLSDRVLGLTKDNLIMSSAASNIGAVVMLTVLVSAGFVSVDDLTGGRSGWVIVGGTFILIIAMGAILTLRKAIFTSDLPTLGFLFGTHTARFVTISALQVLQWWVVLPDTPFTVWATVLAVYTVAHRLPLIPAKDLVSATLVVSIGGTLDASTAAIASMLVVRAAMEKAVGAGVYLLAGLADTRDPTDGPTHPDAPVSTDRPAKSGTTAASPQSGGQDPDPRDTRS